MYARIIVAVSMVSMTSQSTAATNQSAGSNLTRVRNQVTRILVITGVVFFVLQIPLRLVSVDRVFQNLAGFPLLSKKQRSRFVTSRRFWLLINSATNSLIHAFTSPHYRQGFREAFSFRKSGQKDGIQLKGADAKWYESTSFLSLPLSLPSPLSCRWIRDWRIVKWNEMRIKSKIRTYFLESDCVSGRLHQATEDDDPLGRSCDRGPGIWRCAPSHARDSSWEQGPPFLMTDGCSILSHVCIVPPYPE